MVSIKSGTHFKMTSSLLILSVICLVILFIFIDSDLGIYPMSQASSLEELEFPLLFFGSMLFFFVFLQAVASVWLVTPPEDETASPNSDPFTGQWTRSQRLFEDICLCRAHLRYHLFQKISSKSPSSSCKNLSYSSQENPNTGKA